MPDLRMNYYALEVALTKGCLPEIAFDQLEPGKGPKFKINGQIDIKAMKILHNEDRLTYRQIGELYSVHRSYIFKLLARERRNSICPDKQQDLAVI